MTLIYNTKKRPAFCDFYVSVIVELLFCIPSSLTGEDSVKKNEIEELGITALKIIAVYLKTIEI